MQGLVVVVDTERNRDGDGDSDSYELAVIVTVKFNEMVIVLSYYHCLFLCCSFLTDCSISKLPCLLFTNNRSQREAQIDRYITFKHSLEREKRKRWTSNYPSSLLCFCWLQVFNIVMSMELEMEMEMEMELLLLCSALPLLVHWVTLASITRYNLSVSLFFSMWITDYPPCD